MITYVQERVVEVRFELREAVRDFSFSSCLFGLGDRGKTMLVGSNINGQHVWHNSLFVAS
jgi:hypothetical protein